MNPRHILGLLIMGALALAVSGLVGGSEAASARRLPACPQTWPETTGWHGNWYVIVDQDSNGNKHGRAYPADARYQQGYVPAAPHETCIVRIGDNPGVTQLSFREDRDRTRQTPVAGNGASGNQGGAGSETPTSEPTDPSTYSVSPAAVVAEGRSAALTITLSEAAPAGGVAFTVTPGYDGAATAEAADVGSIATPVTVLGGHTTLTIPIPTVSDYVDEDVETFTVVIAAATTTGWVKTGDGGDTAVVTIVDNDTAGVTVSEARPLAVSEGGSATYTVVLNSRPTANVTVTAVSGDIGAATVNPASHTFSPSEWDRAKTFTVGGVSDDDTNDERVGIGHRVTSADAKYAGALVSSVRVVVSDTTSAGEQGSGGGQSTPTPTPTSEPTDPSTYSVSPAAVVAEGRSAALTITLSEAAPAGGVAFTVTPGYDGAATAEAADVGSIATPVTVLGGHTTLTIPIPTVSDYVDEDVETFTVVIAAAATTGWVKTGDGGDTAVVTIVDNDIARVTVSEARPLAVSEGGSATYTVVLNSRPTANVTVTAVSGDIGAATVNPASHTFSPSEWDRAKTFTVGGVSDDDTNDERVGIGHRVTSADAKYAGALVSSVRVVVSDTTSAGEQGSGGGQSTPTPTPTSEPTDPSTYSVSPAAVVAEGRSAALTITLSEAAPAGGVAFTVTPGYDGAATAEAADVGSIATPVTVLGGHTTLTIPIPTVSDYVDEDVETFTVVIAAAATTGWVKTGDGGDTAVVTIVDNDTAGVTVSEARPLAVSEGGSATYTVVLNSRPTANVTVTAVSGDIGAATVNPASHTFSPSEWDRAKTFTVGGVSDDDTNDERVGIGHRVTSADAKYAGALVSSVRVVVSDTTSAGEQGSGGGQSTPTPTQEPDPPGSGNSCPRDYEHTHAGDDNGKKHWHNWSLNEANGQCEHYVGHNGIGYHEH